MGVLPHPQIHPRSAHRGDILYIASILVYMTTVRLTLAQKTELEESKRLLEALEGRRLTRGEAVAELARFARLHREILAERPEDLAAELSRDPMLDLSITFDMGRTDARSIDRTLYGAR